MPYKIGIVGGGIGGLALAARLAKDGHFVHLYEKNERLGGKANQLILGDYRFDTGPSLLTMPEVLEELFEYCDENLSDWLHLEALEILCRYFFPDGTRFNSYPDGHKKLNRALENLGEEVAPEYKRFLDYAKTLNERTETAFLHNPLADWTDISGLPFSDLFRIDAFKNMAAVIDKRVQNPKLRLILKRFATYNGSSPYLAPATLNVIAHVELNRGGHYVKGGMYALVQALEELNQKLGTRIFTQREVTQIRSSGSRVFALQFSDGTEEAFDYIFSNADANFTYGKLLDKTPRGFTYRAVKNAEPSCAGFVILLGVKKSYSQLAHHNIFFPEDYQAEFTDIFHHKQLPENPTIYVANTSHCDTHHAPNGHSNLFILVNSPYIHEQLELNAPEYAQKIIQALEKRGLDELSQHIVEQHILSAFDFEARYHTHKGSIYGTSSNSKTAAFLRPRNRSPYHQNLYLLGGSTHPGGGIPLVCLSAKHAHSLFKRDQSNHLMTKKASNNGY